MIVFKHANKVTKDKYYPLNFSIIGRLAQQIVYFGSKRQGETKGKKQKRERETERERKRGEKGRAKMADLTGILHWLQAEVLTHILVTY